jgi:hypothetical protein
MKPVIAIPAINENLIAISAQSDNASAVSTTRPKRPCRMAYGQIQMIIHAITNGPHTMSSRHGSTPISDNIAIPADTSPLNNSARFMDKV